MNQHNTPLAHRIEELIKQQTEVGIVADYFASNNQHPNIYYVPIGSDNTFICQVNPMRDPAKRAVLKKGKKGCFLCEENMPDEEIGIQLDQNWKMYPNPRPYEKNHTVLVLMKTENYHPFQIIDNKDYLTKAIDIIWQLGYEEKRSDFNLTFNSIKAGASSRHFHYQIFECDLPILNFPVDFKKDGPVKVGDIPEYPASVYVIEGKDKGVISSEVWLILDKLNTYGNRYIPYVILFKVVDGNIRVYIFPRNAEIPADFDSDLINTKFGVCEMSGMTIVYNDSMAKKIDLKLFEKSLKAASNRSILKAINSFD
ncbi:MAG: hypothetical protein HKN00_08765 [Flavobacteriaceae bacterium]|nr:hypothetical protein [Flavobacteriaceae bacterium]